MKLIKTLLLVITSGAVFLILVVTVALFYWAGLTRTSPAYWPRLVTTALSRPSLPLTFLVLGQDPRHDQLEISQTTDSVILSQLSGTSFNAVSFPRDLWDLSIGSRVNRFYWNKIDQNLTGGALWQSLALDFGHLTGINPQRQLLITTDDLVELMSIVGPVAVNLDYDLVDDHYPNPEYVRNPSPDIPVYITVHFYKGQNIITSSNILPFVRSRKGSDDPLMGGTDLGRIARQQSLITALAGKLLSLPVGQKVEVASRLYLYFHRLASDLTDLDLALSLKSLILQPKLKYHFCTIPVYPDNPQGIIYHPSVFPGNAWVYLPLNNDYSLIHQFTRSCLNQ